jgi:hypothetical protein
MKNFLMTIFFGLAALLSIAQEAQTSLVSYTGNDKLAIARNSIDIPSWHEKSFWPLYENYLAAAEEIGSRDSRLRKTLASLDNSTTKEDAALTAESLLKTDLELFTNKREYYQKMCDALNGQISLQFLQGEVVMDMMDFSKAYEGSILRKYRFHPRLASEAQMKKAKQTAITNALGLNDDNSFYFFNIYNKYEEEVDNILGEDYTLISFYAGDPADFTPALAKRLGHDLLSVMEREIKLKEKYYSLVKEQMGPVLAAKFLAWEDYYSIVSKMHAWADAN